MTNQENQINSETENMSNAEIDSNDDWLAESTPYCNMEEGCESCQ